MLTVVGRGPDLAAARAAAERAADAVTFAGLQRRHDIAAAPGHHPEGRPPAHDAAIGGGTQPAAPVSPAGAGARR